MIDSLLTEFMPQREGYKLMKRLAPTQNKRILELLKAHDFVPNDWLIKISKQYNRSISDLRKKGYVIETIIVKKKFGKKLLGYDLSNRLRAEYESK